MRNDELKHYGVLGMKWGVRRYQPYSVKPRESGKTGKEVGKAAQYAKEMGRRLNTKSIQTKKGSENISPATAITREGRNIADSASRIANRVPDAKRRNFSNMSDSELRAAINRLDMERRYDDLLRAQAGKTGKQKVIDILDTAGDVLAIGTSAAILTSIIMDLSKK